MSSNKILGVTLAAAAALAFTAIPAASFAATAAKVQCMGVNACEGKSACKTATNACKGQNACKGKGMMMKSEKGCMKAKGKVMMPEAAPAAEPAKS